MPPSSTPSPSPASRTAGQTQTSGRKLATVSHVSFGAPVHAAVATSLVVILGTSAQASCFQGVIHQVHAEIQHGFHGCDWTRTSMDRGYIEHGHRLVDLNLATARPLKVGMPLE